MSFGQQLRSRRERLEISRAALAAMLGVTVSAVSNYENGSSFPREEVLLRLFDALHAEPNELFCDDYCSEREYLAPDERALLAHYRALGSGGRRTAGTVVAALRAYQGKQ